MFFTYNRFVKWQTDILVSSIRVRNISIKCVSIVSWFNNICYQINIFESSILRIIFHKLSWSVILCSYILVLGCVCGLISVRFIKVHSLTSWKTLIQYREISLWTLYEWSGVLLLYPGITIRLMLRLIRFLKYESISVFIINGEDVVV